MTAAEIAFALSDMRKEGCGWRCRCPLHGGRSLVLRDGDQGRLLVTCWAGCNRLDVLAELRARGLVGRQTLQDRPVPDRPPNNHPDADARRIARATYIWTVAENGSGSPAAYYLASRGIVLNPWPAVLRYHRRCRHPSGEPMPAMVALVEHVSRGIVGVHRTYLTADCRRYDRASLGLIGGGAIRLSMPRTGEWFGVAEGIETAAAVMISCSMPAWAAISASGIRGLLLPPEATHVVISADHDASGTGECAAHDAAERWLAEGRRVRIALPPEPGTDMADLLIAADTAETAYVA